MEDSNCANSPAEENEAADCVVMSDREIFDNGTGL